jgi:hypothetical protein
MLYVVQDLSFWDKYYRVQTRYWITISKQTTKQHVLLGNIILIGKCTQALLGNAFANNHFTMDTIGIQQ